MSDKQLLTSTRKDCFLACRRKHYFQFELGIDKPQQKATRMGSAFHAGVEALALGRPIEEAMVEVSLYIQSQGVDTEESWGAIECATVQNIVNGYFWRWREDGLVYHEVEKQFQFRLPRSRAFVMGGKIDGIALLAVDADSLASVPAASTVVVEHKLLGEEIDDEAPLWKRVALDSQVGTYLLGARTLGYKDVSNVLYDVARKPTIKATERGRELSPEEWGEKLRADIGTRPDFYFNRKLISRSEDELREQLAELVETGKLIQDARKRGQWPKRVSKDTCPWCQYFPLCCAGWTGGDGSVPEGFTRKAVNHPELEEEGVDAH